MKNFKEFLNESFKSKILASELNLRDKKLIAKLEKMLLNLDIRLNEIPDIKVRKIYSEHDLKNIGINSYKEMFENSRIFLIVYKETFLIFKNSKKIDGGYTTPEGKIVFDKIFNMNDITKQANYATATNANCFLIER